MNGYTATITCPVPAEKVFKAITEEMSEWWTLMSGKFLKVGDQAKTDFGGKSYWTFEAIRLDEFSRIEMTCVDANHIHEGLSENIRTEWLGTTLIFEITETEGQTQIEFVHQGLVKNLECFDVCKAGWDHYFLGSLKDYLSYPI